MVIKSSRSKALFIQEDDYNTWPKKVKDKTRVLANRKLNTKVQEVAKTLKYRSQLSKTLAQAYPRPSVIANHFCPYSELTMQTLMMDHVPGASITDRIFEIIANVPGCQMRDVARLLPDLSLQQVFNALQYLRSNRQLSLKMSKHEGVSITVSPQSFN
jgi:hypothetical protein